MGVVSALTDAPLVHACACGVFTVRRRAEQESAAGGEPAPVTALRS
ncbi:hypothetical protein ABT404_37410 [Streptomyces hyaluromycini]|uniref:Uncharacterized protein n=1 Tax=Streptomyces hyaluromycini TaxID=1377993 RepID=A0ABV1X7U2_9ACTN